MTFTIDINDGLRRLGAERGQSLFDALKEHGIFLPTICGGKGLCGRCRLTVLSGGTAVTPAERKHLRAEQLDAGARLGCQVKVTGDVAVRIPDEVLEAKPFRGVLEDITDLTHDIKMLRIGLVRPERIEFTPGQYIKLEAPGADGFAPVSRAFSIASRPSDDGHVELIIRRQPGGVCTGWIFERLGAGDEITFNGPYGRFRLSDSDREMVWVAGGSGMSTFWSILRHLAEIGCDRACTLYFGAVAKRDLYLVEELRQLQGQLGWFTFVPALSDPAEQDEWAGETGLITEVLERHLADGSGAEAYLCGSPGMIWAAVDVLRRKGIPAERTFRDEYARLPDLS